MIARSVGTWLIAGLSVVVIAGCGESKGGKAEDGRDRDGAILNPMDSGLDGGGRDGGKKPDPDSDSSLPGDKTQAKVVSVGPPYTVAEEKYEYAPKSNEAEAPEWKVKEGPSGMTVDEKEVSWTPTKEESGKHKVVIEGMSGDKAVTQEYEITVGVSEKRAEGAATPKDGGKVTVSSPTSKIQGTSISTGPGAMKEEKNLTISELDKAPPMSNKSGDLKAVEFGPRGQSFAQPALVALPLPDGVVLNAARLGAFVYNTAGRWERVRAVGVDLEQGFIFAQAQHFSIYAAAQGNLDMSVSVERMPSTSACEGKLVGLAQVGSPLSEIEGSAVNNASPAIKTLLDMGGNNVEALLADPGFSGSLRFVRVLELSQGAAATAVTVEQRMTVSTLYASGDGAGVVRHTRTNGDLIEEISFANLAGSAQAISQHLRGAASHVFFSTASSEDLSVAARLHIVYSEGDASLDPISPDDLGLAAIDVSPSSPGAPDVAANFDVDCDRLANSFDSVDDRMLPKLIAEPDDVISTFAGTPVVLRGRTENIDSPAALSFSIIAGNGAVSTVAEDVNARSFRATSVGRHLVEMSVPGTELSSVFAIDVLAVPAVNTPPTCTPAAGSLTAKVGETVGLSAVAADAESKNDTLSIEWGFVDNSGATPTLLSNGQLQGFAQRAVFTPMAAGEAQIGCRAWDGTTFGPVGQIALSVLQAQANRVPENLFLSPPSSTVLVGETVSFKAQGSDPDGDALTFTWSSNAGSLAAGTFTSTSSSNVFTPSGEGVYEVAVTVGDGKAPAQRLTASVLVITNRTQLMAVDADGDGFPAGVGPAFDCNDSNPSIYPTAIDICGNAFDEDCSGSPNMDDCDKDGFTTEQGDCNDTNANIGPENSERCNGIDDNCSEGIDEGFQLGGTCTVGVGACSASGSFVCAADGQQVVCAGQAGAGSAETCDGTDQDCDGAIDEGLNCDVNDPDAGTGTVASVFGAWWECESASCTSLTNLGLHFLSDGQVAFLNTEERLPFDPVDGSYCLDGGGTFTVANDILSISFQEGEQTKTLRGTLLLTETRATITWLEGEGPPEEGPVMELLRVEPQAATECPGGSGQCLPTEEGACGNGFDDDCDRCPDDIDSDCGGPGCSTACSPHEICGNDANDDCDEFVADADDDECQPPCAVEPQQSACAIAGESCSNAIDISALGLFTSTVGSINDVNAGCGPMNVFDRVFFFDLPAGPDVDVVLGLNAGPNSNLSLSLLETAPGTLPAACPSPSPGQTFCSFGNSQFSQRLPGGRRFFVFVEGAPAGVPFTLQFGKKVEGTCMPSDLDGDGRSLCDGDCDEGSATTYPGAEELCNDVDDNCNGMVDELDTVCETSVPGVCGLGRPVCGEIVECIPIQQSTQDYCGDNVDNDCDGQVDELDCVDAQGEACTNAIPVGNGGTFSGTLLNAANDAQSGCGFEGAEIFYTFTIEQTGTELFFQGHTGPETAARYALYRDCALERFQCYIDYKSQLEPGTYLLAVEHDGSQGNPSYQFSIGFQANGECLTPDGDGDGETLCAGDCNDDNVDINRAGDEGATCDTLDNDCNGLIDDLSTECQVPAELGVCALGRERCDPEGIYCEPLFQADPQGRDFCNDTLDNDCDGTADDADVDGCVEIPDGDVCTLAEDLGTGGIFEHTLAGFGNDADVGCGDGGAGLGNIERFYSLTITESRRVHIDFGQGGMSNAMSVVMATSCAGFGPRTACSGGYFDQELPAGTYLFAVHGKNPESYTMRVFSMLPGDAEGTSCSPSDGDGDGFNLCTNDCDESAANVNPGELEVCDGLDNDCDGLIDQGPCNTGEPGVGACNFGHYECTASTGEPAACVQNTPLPEICNGSDDDCDGAVDDGISCDGGGTSCSTLIDAESCTMAGCQWDSIKNICNPTGGGEPPQCKPLGTICASGGECCEGFCDVATGKCAPPPTSSCGGYGSASACEQDQACFWDSIGMKCVPSQPPPCACDVGPACDPGSGGPCACDPHCAQQCKPDGNVCVSNMECCSGMCDPMLSKCVKP